MSLKCVNYRPIIVSICVAIGLTLTLIMIILFSIFLATILTSAICDSSNGQKIYNQFQT